MFYLQKYQHGLTFSSNIGQSWKMQTKHRPPNQKANTLLHTFCVNDANFITGLSESLSVEEHYESSRPFKAIGKVHNYNDGITPFRTARENWDFLADYLDHPIRCNPKSDHLLRDA